MAAPGFESLSADIKNKKFAPVYFLCGEEGYFIDTLTDLIEQHSLNDMEKAFNLSVLYGKDLNARLILETCGRLPMMAERQVVIIKEAQALSIKEAEEIQYLAYIKKPVKSTVLVFAWKHGAPDGRKAFAREMKKTVYFDAKPMPENQVAAWLKNWLSKKKYSIEERAADLLVEYTGNDIAKVANELEKLIINKLAGATISLDDIAKGVGISKEFNPFELNNALGTKNKTKAYQIINYFIANPKNGPIVLIMGSLQGFFSKVYLVHKGKGLDDKEMAAVTKINPYYLKEYKAAAKNYPEKKLEQVFYILEEFDLRSKGVNNPSLTAGELLKEMVGRILN